MKTYEVIETVTISRTVRAYDEEDARSIAFAQLPDYRSWDLTDSQGVTVIEIEDDY